MSRGRDINSFGMTFTPANVGGMIQPQVGQPTRVRTWGVPTGSGWFDRPGKWNRWIVRLPWALALLLAFLIA
jgi:hypothetical protein